MAHSAVASALSRRNPRGAEIRLAEALESVTEGVVLFGADDRLVLSNAKYREIYPLISDILVPGVSFEGILRAAVERGRFEDANGRIEEWVAERVTEATHPGRRHRFGRNRHYRAEDP